MNFKLCLNKGNTLKYLFYSLSLKLVLITLLGCVLFSDVQADSADTGNNNSLKEDILNALEKKYSGKSFEADFIQTSRLEALDINETASGHALFSHPGKMRWQYLAPEQHEIITNGTSLWIYRPREKQVMLGDATSFFQSGAGGAFLSDISLVRKNFAIELKTVTPDHVELTLTAKKELRDISSIVIQILKPDSLIQKVITYNTYKDSTLFEFSNIKFNPIDPDTFEFIPPAGVSIIEMN